MRQGYGCTAGGGAIGRQAVYGSSCAFRESISFFAQGCRYVASSPGFIPASVSKSLFTPPRTHGPDRSGLPSGSLGAGRPASLAEILVPPKPMLYPPVGVGTSWVYATGST